MTDSAGPCSGGWTRTLFAGTIWLPSDS